MERSDDDEGAAEKDALQTSITSALITYGGAMVGGATGFAATAAAGAAALVPIADHLRKSLEATIRQRSQARTVRYANGFVGGWIARGAIEPVRASEGGGEAIMESLEALGRAIDDAVADPLGRLAAEFLESTRPLDPFFFRFRDVLCRLTASDLDHLRKFVRGMLRIEGNDGDAFTWGISDPHACFSHAGKEVRVRIPRDARERLSKLFSDNFLGDGGGFNMSIAQSKRLARILDVRDGEDSDIVVRPLPR